MPEAPSPGTRAKRRKAPEPMTALEWVHRHHDSAKMLAEVMEKASPRKLRLFAIGCPRVLWRGRLPAETLQLLDLAERYAEGLPGPYDFAGLRLVAHPQCILTLIHQDEKLAARAWVGGIGMLSLDDDQKTTVSALVRDVFVNPFRPPGGGGMTISPTAAKVARSIYDERAFDNLPILADALEEGGCTNADVLAHLREPGPHVRGCWALDLLLGLQ